MSNICKLGVVLITLLIIKYSHTLLKSESIILTYDDENSINKTCDLLKNCGSCVTVKGCFWCTIGNSGQCSSNYDEFICCNNCGSECSRKILFKVSHFLMIYTMIDVILNFFLIESYYNCYEFM